VKLTERGVTNDIAEQRRSISADEPDVTRSVAGASSDVTDLQRGAGETGSASSQVLLRRNRCPRLTPPQARSRQTPQFGEARIGLNRSNLWLKYNTDRQHSSECPFRLKSRQMHIFFA
jgi:hypothetical protein